MIINFPVGSGPILGANKPRSLIYDINLYFGGPSE
jgi:hypothetical protein